MNDGNILPEHGAEFLVQESFIRDVMGFPDGTIIRDIKINPYDNSQFIFKVFHPSLPVTESGGKPAIIEPLVETLEDKTPRYALVVDWGFGG